MRYHSLSGGNLKLSDPTWDTLSGLLAIQPETGYRGMSHGPNWSLSLAFLPRSAMHSEDYAVAGCLSVPSICLSVCLSDAGVVSQWLNIVIKLVFNIG